MAASSASVQVSCLKLAWKRWGGKLAISPFSPLNSHRNTREQEMWPSVMSCLEMDMGRGEELIPVPWLAASPLLTEEWRSNGKGLIPPLAAFCLYFGRSVPFCTASRFLPSQHHCFGNHDEGQRNHVPDGWTSKAKATAFQNRLKDTIYIKKILIGRETIVLLWGGMVETEKRRPR